METKEAPPPRIQHNSRLAAEFMAKYQVACRYPKVVEQLPALAVDHSKLQRFGYNPSIIELNGNLHMAYRYHDGNTLHSDLAIATLNFQGRVLGNLKVELGAGGEDPKLFKFNGLPYMSWVESTFPKIPYQSVVRFGLLDGNKPKILTPALPNNDFSTIQKNWVFFGAGTELYCIYRCAPKHEIYRVDKIHGIEQCKDYLVSDLPGPAWAYGQVRGGTAPVPFEGHLLRFFHSGLDNEFGQYYRRYFMGAYLMKKDPPFEVIATSQKPILYGSELDNTKGKKDCPHYKRQVVFPGGAVEVSSTVSDGWLVSVGVNDSACEIIRVTPNDLHL